MTLQIKYNDNVPAPPAGKANVKWQEDGDGNRSAYVDAASGDVTGPGSSTTGDIAKFADTTGKVLSDSGVPVTQVPSAGEKSALAGTSGTPGSGNKYVTDADSRNTNARTPTGSAGGDLTGTYPNPTIGDDAVTYDKMQDTSTGSILLGRGNHSPGGSGEIEEIALGTGLSMSGTTLNATGGGSSSPLTTKGDVWGYSSADARIPVGSNTTVLKADSAQTLGVKWEAVKDSELSTSDITTNDVSSSKHGFAPKSPADATKFLNGAATPAFAQVKDSDLSTSDITTNDVTTSKHGFTPKAPNDVTKWLRGDGSWATIPSGGGGGGWPSLYPGAVYPTQGNYAWHNQRSATDTLESDGSITLYSPNHTDNQWQCYVESVPGGSTWSRSYGLIHEMVQIDNMGMGLALLDGSDKGYIVKYEAASSGNWAVAVLKVTNINTASGASVPFSGGALPGQDPVFFKVVVDSSNVNFYFGRDSQTVRLLFSEAKTTYISSFSKIGPMLVPRNGFSWDESVRFMAVI